MAYTLYNFKSKKKSLTPEVDSVGSYLQFENGIKSYFLSSPINSGSTVTTAQVGSFAITSNTTGKGKLFVCRNSSGLKWFEIVGGLDGGTTYPSITDDESTVIISPTSEVRMITTGGVGGLNVIGNSVVVGDFDAINNGTTVSIDDAGQAVNITGTLKINGSPLSKTSVGLGNVDNTSDVSKPISTATQTALNAKQATLISATNIKTINGVSLLGGGDLLISSDNQPISVGKGSLLFDATLLQGVNHGAFWRPNIDYSHFFWEAWVRPLGNGTNWTGYIVSDNQGGNHNLLWGIAMGSDNFYEITGNIHDGTTLTTFQTTETYPANHWAHLAVGWDGASIMLWVDGVLSHVQPYSSGRRQNGGNNFALHIAGSDHNNYWGNIAQVRGYEGYGRCCYVNDFSPEWYFRPTSASSTAIRDMPQFMANYQSPQTCYPDLSAGFENVKHDGVPVAVYSALGGGEVAPAYNNLALPTFDPGDILYRTYVPTAPTMPVGAKVWDSFSRANVGYLTTSMIQPLVGEPTFGSTEGGSLGSLLWTSDSSSFPTASNVILNGRAVMAYSGVSMLVNTGLADVDVRVDRIGGVPSMATGLMIRWKDSNNFYAVFGNDTGIVFRKRESGVTTDFSASASTGWVTLRVVVSGTTINIYTGASTTTATTNVYTGTVLNLANNGRHGLYNAQNYTKTVQRADNFVIF